MGVLSVEPLPSRELKGRHELLFAEPPLSERRRRLLKRLAWRLQALGSMAHTYTSKGNRRHRSYVRLRVQKRGWDQCPSKAVPAAQVEHLIADELQAHRGREVDWESLTSDQRAGLPRGEVKRVENNGDDIAITFHDTSRGNDA